MVYSGIITPSPPIKLSPDWRQEGTTMYDGHSLLNYEYEGPDTSGPHHICTGSEYGMCTCKCHDLEDCRCECCDRYTVYCDNCEERLDDKVFAYQHVPKDITSCNAGESAQVCEACNNLINDPDWFWGKEATA
jgi:hypothetical protein